MTPEEWHKHPENAAELAKILNSPIVQTAFSLIQQGSMASAMTGNALLRVAANGNTLFGYDVGRESVLRDLRDLAAPPSVSTPLESNYGASMKAVDPVVLPPKKKRK